MGPWIATTIFTLVLLVTKSNAVRHEAVENVIAAHRQNGIFAQCLPAFGYPDLQSCREAIRSLLVIDLLARHDRAPYVWRAAGSAADTPRKCGRQYVGGEFFPSLAADPQRMLTDMLRELLGHDKL